MLPLHGNPIYRAMSERLMVHRVELVGPGPVITAPDVPASLQSDRELTTGWTDFGGSYQHQVVNVYVPISIPAAPEGMVTTGNTIRVRVVASPVGSFVGMTLDMLGMAPDDSGLYVRLKCSQAAYTGQ